MHIKAILAAGTLLLAQAPSWAHATDFFEGVKRLYGQTFAVTAVCDKDYETIKVIKDVDGEQSMQVKPPAAPHPGWDPVVDSCSKTKAPFSIVVKLTRGKNGNVEAVFDDAATPAESGTIADMAKNLLEQLKDVDSVAGFADRTSQKLDYATISQVQGEPGMLVFFHDMSPRRTVDYLAECFETCDRAAFRLAPIEIYKSGIGFFLSAIDWSLPAGEVRLDVPDQSSDM